MADMVQSNPEENQSQLEKNVLLDSAIWLGGEQEWHIHTSTVI